MPLNSTVGFEAELFLINSSGEIVAKADDVLNKAKSYKGLMKRITKEYAKEVVEINTFPAEYEEATVVDYINAFFDLDEIARKLDLYLLPMAVYPGKYKPSVRSYGYYHLKEQIFGMEVMEKAARVTSFHFHYPMPKSEARVVALYNLFVGFVPLTDLFSQSSPYYNGLLYGKATRPLLYRDMRHKDIVGAYKGTIFGGTASYVSSFEELLNRIKQREEKWKAFAHKYGYSLRGAELLDYYWGTVRLNKVGTIELRSPDINYPSVILDIISYLRDFLDYVEENKIEVVVGSSPYLSYQDGKLFLPPFNKIREVVYLSSVKGFASKELYNYASSFNAFFPFKGRLKKMFEEKKSIADEIIEKGFSLSAGETLDEESWKELSLYVAENMIKEVDEVKKKALSLFGEEEVLSSTSPLMEKILSYLSEKKHAKPLIDLSKASPSRLSSIKLVILSPYLLEREDFEQEIQGICKKLLSSQPFELLLVVFEKDKDKLISLESKVKCFKSIVVEKKGWLKKALAKLLVYLQGKGIAETQAFYFALKNEELKALSLFGSSGTFISIKGKIKEKVDVVVKNLEELLEFVGKKNR